MPAASQRCQLEHRIFSKVEDPVFRRSEADGVPVMVIRLGDRDAAIPLVSLMEEFGIPRDSPDGMVLWQVVAALDFVAAVRPGDPFPREILTGDASWAPDEIHKQVAAVRLRLLLVEWLMTGASGHRRDIEPDALLQIENNAQVRLKVQEALSGAAGALGLATADDVVTLLEHLSLELAYIEAMRDRFLRRVQAMAAKANTLSRGWRGHASNTETMTQVRRLLGVALRQITERFDELDSHTGDILSALRNAERQRPFIRRHRDWLYRSLRAWEPILDHWESASTAFDEGTLPLLNRTYKFLAPRFMAVTEWLTASGQDITLGPNAKRQMIW